MIQDLKKEGFEVKHMCKTIGIHRSGYYNWLKRPKSHRQKEEEALIQKITDIHMMSKQTYGAPRVTEHLKQQGENCNKKRIARLMRLKGLYGVAKAKYKPMTTDSKHDYPVANRLFKTEEITTHPVKPNEIWASDITYIETGEGWLYLAIFMDLFTRKIVGHAMANHMRTELVLEALNMGILNQRPDGANLMTHSDRGSQYAAKEMRKRLKLLGITASMSRKANCYDNAYAESFFHTLKVELIHRNKFKTRGEAKLAIFNFIEGWYNQHRLHSSLGYKSPVRYEQEQLKLAA